MKSFPTLYKISSTGKTSEWTIAAYEGRDFSYYSVTFGYTDGQKQTTKVEVKTGKNIGRSNATTPYEQACLEAESKWNKQIDKGYAITLPSANGSKAPRIAPMLAHKYDDYAHKIKWPCYWQPKLDGVRCLAYRDGNIILLQSRQNKVFDSLPHLNVQINKWLPPNSPLILDGELYVHGESFQELISIIKRDEKSERSELIEYHVYDVYNPQNMSLTFNERLNILNSLAPTPKNIKRVRTGILGSPAELQVTKDWVRKNGYEGIMLRNTKGIYKVGYRSSDLLKVKEFQDDEFEIVGGFENKGGQSGQCTIICKTTEGAEFGVKPEGTTEQREWYWVNLRSIIGRKLIVRFFCWTTSEHPVPRFPIGVGIRDYE